MERRVPLIHVTWVGGAAVVLRPSEGAGPVYGLGALFQRHGIHVVHEASLYLHPEWPSRVLPAPGQFQRLAAALLHPVDVAVFKMARGTQRDMEDLRALASQVDLEEVQKLYEEAAKHWILPPPQSTLPPGRRGCREHRELLARYVQGAEMRPLEAWTAEALAQWVASDGTGRTRSMAPLLLPLVDGGSGPLHPALRDAGRSVLALVRWVPVDPVWGSDAVVAVLDELVGCFGGPERLKRLEDEAGVKFENVWLRYDDFSAAKALMTYVALYVRRQR